MKCLLYPHTHSGSPPPIHSYKLQRAVSNNFDNPNAFITSQFAFVKSLFEEAVFPISYTVRLELTLPVIPERIHSVHVLFHSFMFSPFPLILKNSSPKSLAFLCPSGCVCVCVFVCEFGYLHIWLPASSQTCILAARASAVSQSNIPQVKSEEWYRCYKPSSCWDLSPWDTTALIQWAVVWM